MKRLDEITARLGRTTPGSWQIADNEHLGPHYIVTVTPDGEMQQVVVVAKATHSEHDADFIANARSDMAWLLSLSPLHQRYELDRLRRQVDDLRKSAASLVVENGDLKRKLEKVPAHFRDVN